MGVSESARADLYNGLAETLGPTRADTLMTLLPTYDFDQLVTKTDLQVFKAELKAEFGAEFSVIHARIDRLFYLLVVVMVAMVGAMATIHFA